MKLRNKKTGEIVEISIIAKSDILNDREVVTDNGEPITLSELNEEWEDCEEPKVFYAIENSHGQIVKHNDALYCEHYKEIGNYFETKEEAERAVKKLKAWKRLRDKGFRFEEWVWNYRDAGAYLKIMPTVRDDGITNDLDLLFGGEDE